MIMELQSMMVGVSVELSGIFPIVGWVTPGKLFTFLGLDFLL